MPTLQLERNRVCDWIGEPSREGGLNTDRGASPSSAASALVKDAKGAAYSRTSAGLYFGFYDAHKEIDTEQDVWDLAHFARTKAAGQHFDRAAALAAQLSMTRNELYSKALDYFVERYEREQLIEEINEAYDEEMEVEDEEFLRQARSYSRRLLNTED